mmetsp:Transcript_15969/g.34497  ORF Transcript_15969/g.34497 Transcript_15969/m.34497 type:complete len:890 (+) Transcript_15969:138-2807(+)
MAAPQPWRLCVVALSVVICCSVFHSARASLVSATKRRQLQQCTGPQNIPTLQPIVTHAPVIDLKWLDKNDQTVIAQTKKTDVDVGGLWLSKDGAATWVEKSQALNDTIKAAEPVQIIATFNQKSSPAKLVLLGVGTYIWQSNDYGNTFTARQTPTKWKGSGIKSMKMHPWRDNWLLVLVKRPDCRSLDHAQMECPHDLMLTQDLFGSMTWTNLTYNAGGKVAGFVDFDWAANLCPFKNCPDHVQVADETVFATMYARPGDYDQPWDPDVNFVVSNNFFRDLNTHVRCGNMFELVGHSVYLAFANSCPVNIDGGGRHESDFAKGITLYTSTDGGNAFVQACLPVALKQEGYELMETHDGTGAIVIVDFLIDNGFMDIPASSVYTAGPHHALFSLSLTDVYRADFGFSTDFARIEGLPGVYIANQMVARPVDDVDDYYDLSDSSGKPLVESRITFNGGGLWQRIPAPSYFNNPKCNRCSGSTTSCWLHLNGMSAWDSMSSTLPSVYSNPSAPGLIMATGNVAPTGLGLDDDLDGTCTWLSSDGGVSWSDVGEGAYIYEYADWGSTIIMARHPGNKGTVADEIRFSIDYGRCWVSIPLFTALVVDNIRIEPDGQRPRVVVHGKACRRSSNPNCSYLANDTRTSVQGIMYMVDVQQLMGTKMGQCASTDYEMFSIPTSRLDKTPACTLGKQMMIQRRGQDKLCFNGPDYKRPIPLNTTCNCTQADVECDYGFLRNGGKCSPLPKERMPHCPTLESGSYHVSKIGKRLVHADVCEGVQNIIPDTDGKGTRTDGGDDSGGGGRKHSALFGFFMFMLVSAVLLGIFFSWWRFLATESHKDSVRDVASLLVSLCVGAYYWVVEKIRGRPSGIQEHDLGYFQPLGEVPEQEAGIFTLK